MFCLTHGDHMTRDIPERLSTMLWHLIAQTSHVVLARSCSRFCWSAVGTGAAKLRRLIEVSPRST